MINPRRAWELLNPHLAVWMGAYALYLAISFISATVIERWLLGTGTTFPQAVVWWVWGKYLQLLIAQYFWGGLFRMAINHVRTGRADMVDFFCVYDVLPALLMAGLVLPLMSFLGVALCLVPGILVAGLTMFVLPLIVDQEMGFFRALTASYRALKPHVLTASLFATVMFLLTCSGLMLFGVGLLVSGPLATLAIAIFYCAYYDNPKAEASATAMPEETVS